MVSRVDSNILIEKLHTYGVKPSEYMHIKAEIQKSKDIKFIFSRLFPESDCRIWKRNE
jgi:hypothetical protein